MAEALGTGVIELVADARKLKAGIEEAKKSIRTLGDGQKDISKSASASIDRYIGKLQQQNQTFGKSTREMELFKLALRGASNEQIKSADAALLIAERNEKSAEALKKMTEQAKTFGKAIGTALVTGFVAAATAFELLLGKAAAFQDLSEKVGDSSEALASFAVAAAVGGSNIENVAGAMIKLTKNLTGVDDEAEDAGAALTALGLNIASFKQLSPTEQFETIAKALAGFEDGAAKAAVAMALFGKAGADLLPTLKEVAGETGRQTILTKEQIALADEYKDKQAKTTAQLSLYAQAIAVELLPQITAFTKSIADLVKGLGEFDKGAGGSSVAAEILGGALKAVTIVFQTIAVVASDVGFVLLGVGREIGAIAAQMAALARLDFTGFSAISDAVKEDGQRARAELDKFQAAVMAIGTQTQFANVRSGSSSGSKKPELKFSGKTKKDSTARADAAAQLALDLELIKEAGAAQIDAFKNAESIMQAMRAAQLIDDKSFYESKLAFIQTFAREEEAQLQAQIERRQKEKFTGKEAHQDQLNNQREIAKLQAQILKVRAESVTKIQINSIEEQAALKKIQQGYEDARIAAEQYLATVAKANAREIAGAGRGQKFREDQANRGAIDDRAQAERRRLEGELRRQQITREQFNTYLGFVEDTYRKEVDLYEARSAKLDELQKDWLTGANEALNNYIDMTKDTARQFEEVFTKAFSSLEDFIGELTSGGIKSFKDLGNAFTKLATGIAADFAKIEIRENITGPLAELVKENLPSIGGIFGKTAKSGPSGVIGSREATDIANKAGAGIAGAGKEAANAAQFTTAVTTAGTTFATEATTAGTAIATELTGAGTAFAGETTAAGASITAAAASFAATVTTAAATFASTVTAAGAAGGGTEVAGELGDLLLGSFATGTPYVPKTGPYVLHQGERVIPAGQNGSGGMSIVINQAFPPGTNMETVNQASVKTGRAVRLAQQRGFSG